MMTQSEMMELLKSLIAQWENEVVEFKSTGDNYSTDHVGEYFSALSNEANLRGCGRAWLVFGIDNKTRMVVGTDYRSEPARLNSLKMQITEGTDPSVSLSEIHVLNHPKGRVILFEIPAAPQGIPIAWKGHYYARSGESKVALGLDKLDAIRTQGIQTDWSAVIVPEATIDDLDQEALRIARKGFAAKYANRFSEEEIQGWSTETFLDRAQVTRNGKITRTTLLLLGKAESAHFLNPHPAQITWSLVGLERAYEHFGPPFLLNSTELFKKIRNVQVRILPMNSLLAVDVAKYDKKVLLEGLHNCIAHQNYAQNSRITVTEYPDRLTLFNAGNFFEGDPMDYIYGEKTPSKYRNMMLAKAMAGLNMIDTMGYGIFDMFKKQAQRGFPLQDYEKTPDSVTVTIYGHIIDEAYSALLLGKTQLQQEEIILLDRIQKKLPVTREGVKKLRNAHLVEGRYPNIRIAKEVEQLVSKLREQSQGAPVHQGAPVEQGAPVRQGAPVNPGGLSTKILFILQKQNLSRKQIAEYCNVQIKTGSLSKVLRQLLKLGLIERTEIKLHSHNQAYRMTESGKLYLENQSR